MSPKYPYTDKPIKRRYSSIGEVAKQFNVATSLIRFWDDEFVELKIKKNKKGNRKFTPNNIKWLQKIYDLVKVEEYTLSGARRQFRLERERLDHWDDVYGLKKMHIKRLKQ